MKGDSVARVCSSMSSYDSISGRTTRDSSSSSSTLWHRHTASRRRCCPHSRPNTSVDPWIVSYKVVMYTTSMLPTIPLPTIPLPPPPPPTTRTTTSTINFTPALACRFCNGHRPPPTRLYLPVPAFCSCRRRVHVIKHFECHITSTADGAPVVRIIVICDYRYTLGSLIGETHRTDSENVFSTAFNVASTSTYI